MPRAETHATCLLLLLLLSGLSCGKQQTESDELTRLRAELQSTRAQLDRTVAENRELRRKSLAAEPQLGAPNFPRVLHQTGPSETLPDRYAPYVKSWIYNNPGWRYR